MDDEIQKKNSSPTITGKFSLPTRRNEFESHKEHYNYFKFADDDDDDDTSSTIRSNVAPRKAIRIEELNDLRTRLCEMDNEIHEHGRRFQRMGKNFKAMIYVIVFCVFLHFIM
ncbi:hypothetical protein HYC85_028028 [Camellia sinensis]|uniref:Uncharacterized protein n=1 Tax=Camellia sinensis TaxID=4442 RepID=A0A7J7FUR1_CAMSI|nr:hypothetical protein HYC85_028028 [Camellia sinensis]